MQFTIMARGYQTEEIKEKLVDLLTTSRTGLSGLEISERLEINRITTTKYLNIFAAEGLIKQKNIGNVNLWFIEDGTEKFNFPEDLFKVKTKYVEYLTARKEQQVYNLVRNSFHSTKQPVKIITEIVVPAIESIYGIFDQGKIGKSELNLLEKIFRKVKFLRTIFDKPEINIANVLLFNQTLSSKYAKIFCCRNTINL